MYLLSQLTILEYFLIFNFTILIFLLKIISQFSENNAKRSLWLTIFLRDGNNIGNVVNKILYADLTLFAVLYINRKFN
jgi:hypothetical protein